MAKRGLKPGCVKTPGSGRKKGTPNKATADIKALAQVHTPRALQVLADIMEDSESDPARVAAVKELLDRGHGKTPQQITGPEGGPIVVEIVSYAASPD